MGVLRLSGGQPPSAVIITLFSNNEFWRHKMIKSDLANRLRQRQHALGVVRKEIIDTLTDDEVINSDLICKECGWKALSAQRLEATIQFSCNIRDFLLRVGCYSDNGKTFVCGGVYSPNTDCNSMHYQKTLTKN